MLEERGLAAKKKDARAAGTEESVKVSSAPFIERLSRPVVRKDALTGYARGEAIGGYT